MFASLALLTLLQAAPPPTAGGQGTPGVQVQEMTYSNTRFDVVWVDLQQVDLRVLYNDSAGRPLRTFAAAQAVLGGSAAALTNAGIFEPGQKPTGLLISDGKQVAPVNLNENQGNFYLVPNGVFYVDPSGGHVTETHVFNNTPPRNVTQATQSGPLLLWGGRIHPGFVPSSANGLIRSGVGVAASNRVALVVSRDKVTFYTLALFFRDVLECNNALYLDGTISQLYAPPLNRVDPRRSGPFAGIIAVVPRQAATGR